MNPVFESRGWEIEVSPPWRAVDCEHCVEITQPEGPGALHISCARKQAGAVRDEETLAQIQDDCPDGIEFKQVRCGDFVGYVAEYFDWGDGRFWRKWFVACRRGLLFVSYTCQRGEGELEAERAAALLVTLRSKE